jgi:hypothetical protein
LTLGLALGVCAADAEEFGVPVAPAELGRYTAIPPRGAATSSRGARFMPTNAPPATANIWKASRKPAASP